jgi:hypothetical protein
MRTFGRKRLASAEQRLNLAIGVRSSERSVRARRNVMRVQIIGDGRVLQGTALQMVQMMQAVAFGKEELSLSEYIDWVASQVARYMGVTLDVRGETPDDKARSLIDELLRTGFVEEI